MNEQLRQRVEVLAHESIWSADEWQDAINTLGSEAQRLLPSVEQLAARGYRPYTSACALLAVMNLPPVRIGGTTDLWCRLCGHTSATESEASLHLSTDCLEGVPPKVRGIVTGLTDPESPTSG